ncbi:MAG TPA: hypothetical protein VG370_29680, partial [Chloroflexota bacterium]|nr:hypothetical protein [Chloroflexota bacterium]
MDNTKRNTLIQRVYEGMRVVDSEVAQPIRADLLRVGFVKVDGPNLFDTDRYVRADVIEAVEGDTVRIRL